MVLEEHRGDNVTIYETKETNVIFGTMRNEVGENEILIKSLHLLR